MTRTDMHRFIAESLLALWLVLDGTLPRAAAEPRTKGEDETPRCVHWHTRVRYSAYAYDHVVHIENACEAHARCNVRTDVHPEAIETTVAAGEEIDLLTYRGSPAREFTAHVACELEP